MEEKGEGKKERRKERERTEEKEGKRERERERISHGRTEENARRRLIFRRDPTEPMSRTKGSENEIQVPK